jgi:hypothetical protein
MPEPRLLNGYRPNKTKKLTNSEILREPNIKLTKLKHNHLFLQPFHLCAGVGDRKDETNEQSSYCKLHTRMVSAQSEFVGVKKGGPSLKIVYRNSHICMASRLCEYVYVLQADYHPKMLYYTYRTGMTFPHSECADV